MALADTSIGDLVLPWRQIADKVDAFFEQALSNHADAISCRAGCSGCCQPGLTVTLIEALALVEALELMDLETRQQIAVQGHERHEATRCAFLLAGRCSVYAHRPIVCRSHGLPVRHSRESDDRDPLVGCCELNFIGSYPDDAVLDGTLLAAWLLVADGIARRRLEVAGDSARLALDDLAQHGRAALPSAIGERLVAPAGPPRTAQCDVVSGER